MIVRLGLLCVVLAPAAAQAEGNPWWLWIVVLVILAGFVAFMLWWWLRSPQEEEGPPHPPAAEPPALVPGPGAAVSPDVTAVPEVGRAPEWPEQEPVAAAVPTDDLEIIEGIGPRLAAVLREAGVYTFEQLAALDAERLRQLLRDRDPRLLRLADPTTWPEQARLAAEEDWDGLEKLQAQLTGGRH